MGIPFTLSVLDHHRSYIAVLDLLPDIYVQLWLFSLATQRRQETECSRDVMIYPVVFSL